MELLSAAVSKLGIYFTPLQINQFETYYRELVEWNKRTNLTRITDYEEVQTKHFLDALTVTLFWKPHGDEYVIDVGTGAGIPGLPLKIVYPDFKLALLEASGKKVTFLEHIVQKLGLKNIEIINARAEETARDIRYREQFDVILSRAVAELPTLVELALPLCRTGGIFIASKKGNTAAEIQKSAKALVILGGKLKEIVSVPLSEFNDERQLLIIEKVTPTPEKYPRRPGIPEKRPIQ